jgi:hypothetical protein
MLTCVNLSFLGSMYAKTALPNSCSAVVDAFFSARVMLSKLIGRNRWAFTRSCINPSFIVARIAFRLLWCRCGCISSRRVMLPKFPAEVAPTCRNFVLVCEETKALGCWLQNATVLFARKQNF